MTLSPITKRYLIEGLAYASAGVATKSVGSYYRFKDDLKAPEPILTNTIKREATMLGIAGASMMAIQLLFSVVSRKPTFIPAMSKMFKSSSAFKRAEPLIRLFLAVPAFALAESVSRVVGPRGLWGPNDALAQEKPSTSLPLFNTTPIQKIKAKPLSKPLASKALPKVHTGSSLQQKPALASPYSPQAVFVPSLSGYYGPPKAQHRGSSQLYFHA